MNPADFLRLFGPLPEPFLLTRASGEIEAANAPAARLLGIESGSASGHNLLRLTRNGEQEAGAFLRSCAASGAPIPGALTLRGSPEPVRIRCDGFGIRTGAADATPRVLLRLRPAESAASRFLVLNEQIDRLTREAQHRVRVEAALRDRQERSAFLAEASRILASSLDLDETLRNVARAAVPVLADWCAVDLLAPDGTVRRVAVEHTDSEKVRLARELQERYPAPEDAPRGVQLVIRTGAPDLMTDIPDSLLVASAVDEGHLHILRELGLRSYVCAPLAAGEELLGAITLVHAESGRQYTESDLEFVTDLGRRAAVAIQNARLVRELTDSRARIADQAQELEAQAEELQAQTAHLEEQAVELEQQLELVRSLNEDLQRSNVALSAATAAAEQNLRLAEEAEQYVRGILEGISDPFVVQDGEWRFRYVNEAAARAFASAGGGSRQELIGQVLWEVYPDIVGTRFEQEMRRAVREQTPVTFEEYYPATGSWAEMRCYPLPGRGLATVWKDVTERKRTEIAERVYAEAGAILSYALDVESTLKHVAQIVVPALADYCLIDIQEGHGFRRVASVHGDPTLDELMRLAERYAPSWSRPDPVMDVIRTGRPKLIPDGAAAVLEQRAPDPECRRLVRNLAPRTLMIVPLQASNGVRGAITLAASSSERAYTAADLAVAQEISRRVSLALENARLFAAEQAARAEAERASQAKSQFLAVMSHELRTPLNAILGYADLLDLGVAGALNEHQKLQLDRVRTSARHLRELIDQVLGLARIEAGREEMAIESFDLLEVARDALSLIEPLAKERGLDLSLTSSVESVSMRSDAGKVRQVLLNLLGNSVKFTEEGGVDLRVEVEQGSAVCRVTDSGVGIAPEDLERIFEPFTQVDQSKTRRVGGSGLGLAVSRQLARLLGGDLQVDSTVGVGSTFSLVLPLESADPERLEIVRQSSSSV